MDTSETPVSREIVATELKLAIGQLLRRLRAEANPGTLNLSQMGVLARLDQNGSMTTADLARAEAMKPQSMSTILSGLEQDDLVERRPHPSDGRQVLFSLTTEGAETRRQRNAAKQEWLLAALANLDAQELQTLLCAAALIKRMGDS